MHGFARTSGAAVDGTSARLVDVQVRVAGRQEGGQRAFRIVGLPDSALREGRDRIRAAVLHAGWHWPFEAVTVNLAPAAARKQGAALDLPIALALLGADGALGDPACLRGWACAGELTLDGRVRAVRGVLAATEAARAAGLVRVLVPRENAVEAAAVEGAAVFAVGTLREAVGHLNGTAPVEATPATAWTPDAPTARESLVRGQPAALRAAWIAAAGGHNLLLSGPPGSGKTLLAREVRDLLPPLTREEALEISRVHSVAGLLDGGLVRKRPLRCPHHTTSLAGLVGGGTIPGPGEVSLAHRGVLFLDELAEFPRPTLEALRQPIEDGTLVISRAAGRTVLPASVLLVAAMNPCPCGWYGVRDRCRCQPASRERYENRVSGPMRDRFDIQVTLLPVDPATMVGEASPPPFTAAQVAAARRRQAARARRLGLRRAWNADLPPADLPAGADLEPSARKCLVVAARRLGLSGRGVHRAVRVGRTLADLADRDRVQPEDVLNAVHLRTERTREEGDAA